MATVNVQVNGRAYTVGCEDGQEEHVKGLAEQFDKQVQDIAEQVGAVGELRLFLLAALTTADELQEAKQRAERLASGRGFPATAAMPADNRVEQRAAAALESAAQRLEQLAEQVA